MRGLVGRDARYVEGHFKMIIALLIVGFLVTTIVSAIVHDDWPWSE